MHVFIIQSLTCGYLSKKLSAAEIEVVHSHSTSVCRKHRRPEHRSALRAPGNCQVFVLSQLTAPSTVAVASLKKERFLGGI